MRAESRLQWVEEGIRSEKMEPLSINDNGWEGERGRGGGRGTVGDNNTEACLRSLLRFSMHRLETRSS